MVPWTGRAEMTPFVLTGFPNGAFRKGYHLVQVAVADSAEYMLCT